MANGGVQAWMVTWSLVSRALLNGRGTEDGEVPPTVRAQLERLHAAVAGIPSLSPHVQRLESEAALVGAVTMRTWRRLCRALEEAAAEDDTLAATVTAARRRLDAADSSAGYPLERALRTVAWMTVSPPAGHLRASSPS